MTTTSTDRRPFAHSL